MGRIITAKIDVTKIDKAKLFKGQKGTYLDIVLLEKESKSSFGDSRDEDDFMVCLSVTKEERESGKRGAILGNAKYIRKKAEEKPAKKKTETVEEPHDDVPF